LVDLSCSLYNDEDGEQGYILFCVHVVICRNCSPSRQGHASGRLPAAPRLLKPPLQPQSELPEPQGTPADRSAGPFGFTSQRKGGMSTGMRCHTTQAYGTGTL
jgi:hypothetical protein